MLNNCTTSKIEHLKFVNIYNLCIWSIRLISNLWRKCKPELKVDWITLLLFAAEQYETWEKQNFSIKMPFQLWYEPDWRNVLPSLGPKPMQDYKKNTVQGKRHLLTNHINICFLTCCKILKTWCLQPPINIYQ